MWVDIVINICKYKPDSGSDDFARDRDASLRASKAFS